MLTDDKGYFKTTGTLMKGLDYLVRIRVSKNMYVTEKSVIELNTKNRYDEVSKIIMERQEIATPYVISGTTIDKSTSQAF